jgi:tripartite-type tricarboxylate transporter receptor subunit TctC
VHSAGRAGPGRFIRLLAALALAASLFAPPAVQAAQAEYPDHLVRIVVPYPPGGGMDLVTRTVAAKLSDELGEAVIVDNRPGGSGMIGINAMVNSRPDGYTLMSHAMGFAINPGVYRKLPYDPVKDIQPVAILGFSPVYLAVNPKLEAHDLREFLALAKKRRLKAAIFGFGAAQLMVEDLRLKGGFEVDLIPYNGTAPAIMGTIRGDTDFVVMDEPSLQQHIASGALRPLAVASEKRSPNLPDIPTMREAGLPGVVVNFWYATFARAGTPHDVLVKLNAEINDATRSPEVAQRMNGMGIVPNQLSLDESSRFYLDEVERWKDVVKKANVQPVDN